MKVEEPAADRWESHICYGTAVVTHLDGMRRSRTTSLEINHPSSSVREDYTVRATYLSTVDKRHLVLHTVT